MEVTTVSGFLDYYEKVRQRTLRVAATIPPDQLEWTYRIGRFTIGDLLRHLGAIERYMWAENVQGLPSRYPGHSRKLADGHDAVMAYLKRTHDESMAVFGALKDEDLKKTCTTPAGSPIPIGKWLRSMIEHEIHHRGQIYLYLGILGVPTPPLYGLTSEEVAARSRA